MFKLSLNLEVERERERERVEASLQSNANPSRFPRFFQSVVFVLFVTLFSACSGGGNDSGDNSSSQRPLNIISGYFIDDPVEGLSYVCSSGYKGVTDERGTFTCPKDDNVTFYIGVLKIGTVPIENTNVTPYDIFPNDKEAAVNLARLLQSSNEYASTGNGKIKLNKKLIDQIPPNIDFSSHTFEDEIQTALKITLVDSEKAKQQMDSAILAFGGDLNKKIPYTYGSILNFNELKNNPKKVFNYIKNIDEFFNDNIGLLDQYARYGFDHVDKELYTKYMMYLGSKALYNFMLIGTSKENLNKLKNINFRYTWDIFSTNAYEEYVSLRIKIKATLLKITNKGLVNVKYDEMADIQGYNFADELQSSMFDPLNSGFYYFPMTAYRVMKLGDKDIDTMFQNIKNSIDLQLNDPQKRKEEYLAVVKGIGDYKFYLLSQAPKVQKDQTADLKALVKNINQKASDFMVSYFISEWKGDSWKAYSVLFKNEFLGSLFYAYYGYELYSTIRDAFDTMEGMFDDAALFVSKVNYVTQLESCSGGCGGSSRANEPWRDYGDFKVAPEVYDELIKLDSWEK